MVIYSLKQFLGLAGTVSQICQKEHFSDDELNRLCIVLEPCKPSGEIVMHIGGPAPFNLKQ